MLKKLRAVLQHKKYKQSTEEGNSLVPENSIIDAPQAAPEAQPAPFHEQSTSKLKIAAAVGAGVVAGAAIFCTGGVAASFLLPAFGSFALPATLGMYTAASAVTVAASAGTGVAVAKRVENVMEKHAGKVGAYEESEHLSGAAAAYASPQPVSEESLNEGTASATAASPFLQLVEPGEATQSAESESQLREMAQEDINAVIAKVAMRFIRDGLEMTPQSAPGSSRGALMKWHKENGDMGKKLLREYVEAYTKYLQGDKAQQKTAMLVYGLVWVNKEEYRGVEEKYKQSIKDALVRSGCYKAKDVASLLYPDSQEEQAMLVSNVDFIEKHFYSLSYTRSSSFLTSADASGSEDLKFKQPLSEEASASSNLPAVEYEMQPLGNSTASTHAQEDSSHT